MAWDIAAYAFALAAVVVGGAFAVGVIGFCRSLGRLERMAEHTARKAEAALDECVRFAAEGRETAEMCRSMFGGFARLAEGARAVGDAAESAAEAAAHVAAFWRELATGRFASAAEEELTGAASYWSGVLRTVARNVGRSFYGVDSEPFRDSRPGANADPQTGE
jgi:hypothetical protein